MQQIVQDSNSKYYIPNYNLHTNGHVLQDLYHYFL